MVNEYVSFTELCLTEKINTFTENPVPMSEQTLHELW